jgi:hypothetical protein
MSIKSNVTAALNSAHAYAKAIEGLRGDCKGMERDAVREAMLPCVAAYYAVEVVEGKLSTESKKYEAAKRALYRLLKDVCPSSETKEEVAIPAELLKAAKVLAELAAKYEGSKSLASKALATAFAK